MSEQTENQVNGSFRDPSGFVFSRSGTLYRQVNACYSQNYDLLMDSGLYARLVKDKLLVAHEEIEDHSERKEQVYRVLKPTRVNFISYPFEWCFGQLKDAALATLGIQQRAMEYGMVLKDASAYNIQFVEGNPLLIDTLSFDRYEEGHPWIAYKQFCQHFLAPLTLMKYCDVRLGQMLRTHLDGIPLDLTSSLLPRKTWLSFPLLTNIHLHARSQIKYASKSRGTRVNGMSRRALMGLIDTLLSAVKRLSWQIKNSTWADYYENTNYEIQALEQKEKLVADFLDLIKPKLVWDLGANTGRFSRIAARRGINTIAFDFDPAAVEINYRECRKNSDTRVLPLVIDLTNPSPGIGWEHRERMSLIDRGPADCAMALALIHHLAIGNNLPLGRIARFLRSICSTLIIEFVPKEDSQVQRLLRSREDIFPQYTPSGFERSFEPFFSIEKKAGISDSSRSLYYMKARP
ncbi:MAG: SAM-dependent methyltransferase [Candidatus Zixiibacteriota bacterium]|nr:MAG: SAM-dependent methyltransferase [candidate division Zixibacteria bacterium]